jgi:hypothetical protein
LSKHLSSYRYLKAKTKQKFYAMIVQIQGETESGIWSVVWEEFRGCSVPRRFIRNPNCYDIFNTLVDRS